MGDHDCPAAEGLRDASGGDSTVGAEPDSEGGDASGNKTLPPKAQKGTKRKAQGIPPAADKSTEGRQGWWQTCEVIAAVGAYQAASETKSQQTIADLYAGCLENYQSQCWELEKAGKWPATLSMDESCERRSGKSIHTKAKAVIGKIVNDVLPFVRAAKVGGTGPQGCRSGDQAADWMNVAKKGYFVKWKQGRSRGAEPPPLPPQNPLQVCPSPSQFSFELLLVLPGCSPPFAVSLSAAPHLSFHLNLLFVLAGCSPPFVVSLSAPPHLRIHLNCCCFPPAAALPLLRHCLPLPISVFI